jgi:hypothetical protein
VENPDCRAAGSLHTCLSDWGYESIWVGSLTRRNARRRSAPQQAIGLSPTRQPGTASYYIRTVQSTRHERYEPSRADS